MGRKGNHTGRPANAIATKPGPLEASVKIGSPSMAEGDTNKPPIEADELVDDHASQKATRPDEAPRG